MYLYVGNFPGGPVVKILPCNAGDVGLIPGWGVKIPQACSQKTKQNIKQKQYFNQFKKDFCLKYLSLVAFLTLKY